MPDAYSLATALLVALAVDQWLGEPSVQWHPVVWIGYALDRLALWVLPQPMTTGRVERNAKTFGRGAFVWIGLAGGVVLVAVAVQWAVLLLPGPVAGVTLGLALKPLLAWRMLRTEVQAVEVALAQSLEQGRQRLSWLVSRDTTQLNESQVRESAIESLAENLSDSVVAPIFWFALLGLPGAALYRFANTADAMWGYRGIHGGCNWEWAGKWAARADDVLSWLPARITAVALSLVAGGVSIGALRREARRTPSPNSGWPMGAMALALGVRLQKPGAYVLNGVGRAPQEADTARALCLARNGLIFVVGMALAAVFSVTLLFVEGSVA